MRNLRKLTGAIIFLTFVFMFLALFQYQDEEDVSPILNEIEYYFNEDWNMVSLKRTTLSEADLDNYDRIDERISEKMTAGEYLKVNLPYEGKSEAGDIVVYKNILSEEYAGEEIKFFTKDAAVRVVWEGEEIYQYGVGSVSEKPAGRIEHCVDIPNMFQSGELWIGLTSDAPNAAATLDDVRVEISGSVVVGVMGNRIADIGCCLLMVSMAILLIVLAVIRKYTCRPNRGEHYLALAGLAAGILCFIKTDTLSVFYDIMSAYVAQEYLLLVILVFLTLYFEQELYNVYPCRFFTLLWCAVTNTAAQLLLQITGIENLENMADISVAAICLVCVVSIISLIQLNCKNKHYSSILQILSTFVLLLGMIVDKGLNVFWGDTTGNAAGQYSMTVFFIMMAVMHTLQLSEEHRANAVENSRLLEEKVKVAEQQNIQLALAKKDADDARHEALAANEAKGKFLAHMSHEIRTPINAVLGMDEMILRESKEQNIKEYAMDIYTAGQTLLALINDILDFSKIESGKMEIVPVEYDISSLIHDLANMALQRAEGKNIKLNVEVDHEIPSRLYGDDVRIRQALTNILTNAVKYTHEGNVWLRVQSCKKGETVALKFEVEDTGIGIKEEDLPKLSAEFERIEEDRNRNIEGTGLGMSITIQLLALLGSKLQVESVYGKGSKFSFELEQKVVDHTPIGEFESRVHHLAEKYNYSTKFYAPDAKILVVDDNAVNRKVLRNLLKETRIQVTDAGGGGECLELVQKNHYDLIFLDHMMPDMDGIETLHCIKELSDYPCQDTPIVVLTANAVSGAKEKFLTEGFDDFLSKPIVPDKLENMIKKMLPEELLSETAVMSDENISHQTNLSDDFLEELPLVDGLDWHYAWQHLPDIGLLEYTVKEFYAQIDSAAEHLGHAYEQITEPGQLDQYRIQVHAMKSLAATVGIIPLSGVAKLLECAARDGKTDVVMSVTTVFLEEWCSYREKLRGVFGIETADKREVTDYSVIQALVEMVRISMQEMDIDQADQLISQLRTYEYEEETGKKIQKLAEAVTNLDSEEADRLAELLIREYNER